MKSPPIQYTDDEARRMVEEFITDTRQAQEKKPSEPVSKEVSARR
jgi:hypothetical protein